MEQETKVEEIAGAASGLSDVLDANALNDAGWAFIDAWSKHTDQAMSGNTWNNIKLMVASAIWKYLEATNATLTRGAQTGSETTIFSGKAEFVKPIYNGPRIDLGLAGVPLESTIMQKDVET